jgi:alanine-synthesizing transaminase
MLENIYVSKMNNLPEYIFAQVSSQKMNLRRKGEDIIDFSMGNPDGATPQHIIDKLIEASQNPNNHGYSSSIGIYKLRVAICDWYKRKYNVDLDPEDEAVVTMGSKEGYVHLIQAIANPGDVAIVPEPTYPIHAYAFMLAGVNSIKVEISFNDKFDLDEEDLLEKIKKAVKESVPKPKFILINFPNNPTSVTATTNFYEKIVAYAKTENLIIISDIAYADITYDGYKTPSLLSVKGAKDVAVECFTLSKSYNMAGWRVGFVVGNKTLVKSLQKIKKWIDYGMYTPIQVAATVALNGDQSCVEEIREVYAQRKDILIDKFAQAGWEINHPKATMFTWAKIPDKFLHLGSVEFAKQLMEKAGVAVSPGIAFGHYGDEYVRIAFLENNKRITQASKNLKRFFAKS